MPPERFTLDSIVWCFDPISRNEYMLEGYMSAAAAAHDNDLAHPTTEQSGLEQTIAKTIVI